MPETIRFFRNEVKFRLSGATLIRPWLSKVARKEGRRIGELNYIFCTDEYLLDMNREHLGHDYYTDIITFDLSEGKRRKIASAEPIIGDIYISVDRVKENAESYGVSFIVELQRVMVHGLLHLTGYKDKTKAEKAAMRLKEDACLSLLDGKRG